MTERDDRQTGDGHHRSNSTSERARKDELRELGESYLRRGGAATHYGPTDPAVPIAKRRGACRRRSSFVALSTLVTGLLALALSLLYRASQKVGETSSGSRSSATMAPISDRDRSISDTESRQPPSGPGPERESPKEEQDVAEGGTEAPAAPSPQPKADPPAPDIIRTPAF